MYTVESLVSKVTDIATKVYYHLVMHPEKVKHITYPNEERCLYPDTIDFTDYHIKLEIDPYDISFSGCYVLEHKSESDNVLVLNLNFISYEQLAFLADNNLIPFYIEDETERKLYIGYFHLDEQSNELTIYWHCAVQLPTNTQENLLNYLYQIELVFDVISLYDYLQNPEEGDTFMDLIDYKLCFSIDTKSYDYELFVIDADENGNADIKYFGVSLLNDSEWNQNLLDYVEYDPKKGYIPLIEKASVVDIYNESLEKLNEKFA